MRKILEGGMFSWSTGGCSRRLGDAVETSEESSAADGLTCVLQLIF